MKKRRIIIFIIVLGLLFLTGTIYKYKTNKQPVVIELGIFSGSNWNIPNWQSYRIFDEAIVDFERKNPNIKVKYRSGTLKSDYSEWLAQKIVKGEEPDVFAVLSSDFNTFASIGILKNLDNLIKNDEDFKIKNMYNNSLKSGQLSGYQYALASEISPTLMFVNKTILESEGIYVPNNNWDWKEFYEICKRITKDTDGDGIIDQFGTSGFTWKHAVYTNGQQLFDQNGTKAWFNNPEVIEAVKFTRKLNNLNINFKPAEFESGKVAFEPFTFSEYRAYKFYPYKVNMYNNFEWECIKLPKGPNGRNASELMNFSMGISSRTKHSAEAWKFLKFITSDEITQLNVLNYSYGVPVLRNLVESEQAKKVLAEFSISNEKLIDTKTLSQVIEESIVTPRFQKYEKVMDMADKEIFQIINNDGDIENALSKLNRELTSFLKK